MLNPATLYHMNNCVIPYRWLYGCIKQKLFIATNSGWRHLSDGRGMFYLIRSLLMGQWLFSISNTFMRDEFTLVTIYLWKNISDLSENMILWSLGHKQCHLLWIKMFWSKFQWMLFLMFSCQSFAQVISCHQTSDKALPEPTTIQSLA